MNKKGKRKGVWSEVETFTDPDSHLSVIISERIRGKPEFSVQFVHHDKVGPNKFLPIPCPDAKHPVKDIMYSLAAKAEEYILAKHEEYAAKKSEKKSPNEATDKSASKKKQEKKVVQGGLSKLAAMDAAKKGFQREGQTARKRKKRGG